MGDCWLPESAPLFSDLNQWMLKILLAPPLIPEGFLLAPRERYRNASQLAEAAGVIREVCSYGWNEIFS